MGRVPWDVGQFVHTLTKGSLGAPITKEEADRWRFLRLLYFLNDANKPSGHWERKIEGVQDGFHFRRPDDWAEREPVVDICGYCLMENHYHLLLYERQDDGIASFMESLNSSIANHFKKKYDQSGLLNTPYESRVIEGGDYLETIFFYINIKNPFEKFSGGYDKAVDNFDQAYQFAKDDPFTSLADYKADRGWPIVNKQPIQKHMSLKNLKDVAWDYIINRPEFTNPDKETKDLLIDH